MGRWWSQLRRLHQVAFARTRDRDDEPIPRRAYRRDGWPLCPACGADALMSLTIPIARRPEPTDPMRCLDCRWTGTVVAREDP